MAPWNKLSLACGLAVAATGLAASTTSAAVYTGNGATGFGGPIGNSTLTVTESGANINFSLTTGAAFNDNALIFYVDSGTGGATDTSGLTDVADGGRRAISGLSDTGRSTVTFAPTFDADLAITLQPGVFSGLFNLSTPSNFGFVASGGLSGSDTGPFTFSFTKAQLGIADGGSFDFVGTLISTTAFRSNEAIGASDAGSGNPGFTGGLTFTNFNTFQTAPIPEPASVGLLGVAAVGLLRRRRII